MTDPEPVASDATPVRYPESLAPFLTDADKVTPHPENPRTGDVAVITESIRANGCYRPVYAQRSTGHILAGNHTYEALTSHLGESRVPVVLLDVNDDEAKRILLVDNRSSDLAAYHNPALARVLEQLAPNLGGTGYDAEDYRTVLTLLDHDDDDGDMQDVLDAADQSMWPWVKAQVSPSDYSRFARSPGDSDTERLIGLLNTAGVE